MGLGLLLFVEYLCPIKNFYVDFMIHCVPLVNRSMYSTSHCMCFRKIVFSSSNLKRPPGMVFESHGKLNRRLQAPETKLVSKKDLLLGKFGI